ncbi:MAG: Fpg/Nei family DNA glycosylase [Ferruginibacter sp.]|nr:Fpg/Nei family DNA glycosylase [Ferruginibacter sp.]
MPELPDIEVFTHNLNKLIAGKKLLKIKVVNGKKLKDSPKELSKRLDGKQLKRIYRAGKEMRFEFKNGTLLGLHLMLTGDIFPFEKTNTHQSTIVEMYFEGGQNIALNDRMKNANIKLDPIDKKGVDALAKELNFSYLKEAFKRKKAVKELLLDQNIIRGIGNGYSDEILWASKISPYSIAQAIPDEKIKELVTVIKKTLKDATNKIQKTNPGKVNAEVKDFLKIHTKLHTESPTGATIKIDAKGLRKTYYTDEQVLYK